MVVWVGVRTEHQPHWWLGAGSDLPSACWRVDWFMCGRLGGEDSFHPCRFSLPPVVKQGSVYL